MAVTITRTQLGFLSFKITCCPVESFTLPTFSLAVIDTSISFVKEMTPETMGFNGISSCKAHSPQVINSLSNGLKMLVPDTMSMYTSFRLNMIKSQSFWNGAYCKFIAKAMSKLSFGGTDPKECIAIGLQFSQPERTSVCPARVYMRPEALFWSSLLNLMGWTSCNWASMPVPSKVMAFAPSTLPSLFGAFWNRAGFHRTQYSTGDISWL